MGSLLSPPRSVTPQPGNPSSGYRVFLAFCTRELAQTDAIISNWIECYNPLDNTWTYVSSIPGLIENHVLKGFAMVLVGNSIYIIGGRLCGKKRVCGPNGSDKFAENDVEVRSTVLRYNICTTEWSLCAPLGSSRYNFACTVCENKIYVAGGQSTLASARGISSAEVYNCDLDEWAPLPNMGSLRYKCVGVTWEGKIHVVGGFAEKGDSDPSLTCIMERSSAEVFDALTGKWDLKAKMWQLDVPPCQIVALNGRLFSCGDCLKAWKGHIEYYDGENMWNVVDGSHRRTLSTSASTSDANKENWPPIQKYYLTMAPIGTHLYFLAGYQMAGELSRTMWMVHSFDTSATRDAWTSFEPMEDDGEKELCSHCCVVHLS